ncbi:MAG: hypothetical protein BGN88_06045 [Clostridiales bacterium 43-6]|nr:MAG: hypothetical protein BGN88_06045 [Clostridiales bacterium 43-6]
MKYRFGHFNQTGDEFIITSPNTPRAYDNFIYNNACYANIQQTGVGCFDYQLDGKEGIQLFTGVGRVCDYDVFGRDNLMNRLIYVRDNDTGEFWTVNWEPVKKEYEEYQCKHGLGYTEIVNKTKGTRNTFKLFIPEGYDPVELWELTTANETDKDRDYSLFIYNQFQFKYKWGFDSYGDMIFRTTWLDKEKNTFFATKHPFITPHPYLTAFMAADATIDAFDGTRNKFVGQYSTLSAPDAVVNGSCSNFEGSADATIGALQFNMKLKAGESKKISLILGAVTAAAEAEGLKDKYFGNFDTFFTQMKNNRKALVSTNEVKTPDEHLNRIINYWNKQATLFGSTWCRWGYNGYRDIVQQGYGVSSLTPERTKEILREAFKHQYQNGLAVRGWNPIDDKAYSDSALWLEFTLSGYLRETGDTDFLNEMVPFFDGGEATVRGHIERALDFLEHNKGRNDLLLIKFGDWNDSLTGVGKEGKGESVWLSIAYAQAMREMAELTEFLGETEKKNEYLARRESIMKAINENAWDGGWYRRCYADSGRAIGSKDEKYAKIFMEPQCWSLVAGVADQERAETIIRSMDELLDTPVGYLLLTPSFKEFDDTLGRISAMEPGIAENGTIYSHTNVWMVLGLLKYGMGNRAYNLFKKITPGYLNGPDNEIKETNLPYQYSNCYFGPEHRNNAYQMEYSWITGSVAWFTNVIETAMVGIKPDFAGLRVNPCLPGWEKCGMKRNFRGAEYDITIENPDKLENGTVALVVDGQNIEGDIIPVFGDGKVHSVTVTMK